MTPQQKAEAARLELALHNVDPDELLRRIAHAVTTAQSFASWRSSRVCYVGSHVIRVLSRLDWSGLGITFAGPINTIAGATLKLDTKLGPLEFRVEVQDSLRLGDADDGD